MASIAGGIAAWYGTTTFQSIFAQTRKIEERVVEQQKKIDDQLKIAEENTKNFDNWRKEAETKNRAMQIKLIKFYVVQRYHDFQENFDRLRLDELHRSKSAYANIRLILGELKNAEDFPNELLEDAERKLIIHMEQLVKAVTLYDDIKYDEVTSMFPQYRGEKINIHRLLSAAFGHLYDQSGEQKKYLSDFQYHAKRYSELTTAGNRSHLIAITHSVSALLKSTKQADLLEAEKLLKAGIKLYPNESILRYDYAVIYLRRNDPLGALDRLSEAKLRGDFTFAEDIKYFCGDPDFEALLKNNDKAVQIKLANLLGEQAETACQ